MKSEVVRFTLTSVLSELRSTCASDVRSAADLRRNAVLWLALRAGMKARDSSFAWDGRLPEIDPERLQQPSYLGAVGFLVFDELIEGCDLPILATALKRVVAGAAHTVERRGFADDPLCAAGLLALGNELALSEVVSKVRRSIEPRVIRAPVVALCLTLADRKGQYSYLDPFSDADSGHLACAVLAERADRVLALKMFPASVVDTAEAELVGGLCRGRFQVRADLDGFATLGALELPLRAGEQQATGAKVEEPRTILFLASCPATQRELALPDEAREIENKIRAARHRDSFRLRTRWAVRADDLLQALNEDRPSIVHFSGHGAGRAGIVLHDDLGTEVLVRGNALRRLFNVVKDEIRVVVLSACFSSEQAREIVQVIDCVIGMKDTIGDEVARSFAAAFYRALGFGRSVANAFEQGLVALELAGVDDVDVPELFVRDGVDASQVVIVGPEAA